MEVLISSWMALATMGGLLVFSFFFSASETSLFSLDHMELAEEEREGSSHGRAIAALRRDPRGLLATVLFGNMVVNLLYFCTSVVVSMRLGGAHGAGAAFASGVGALAVLIVCSEVTPKALAVSHPVGFASAAAVPLFAFYELIAPVRRLVAWIARPTERGRAHTKGLDNEELMSLVQVAERSGVLGPGERKMMEDVLELGLVKLREVMTPRVDLIACDARTPPAEALALARRYTVSSLPLYDGTIDNIVGVVRIRDVFFAGDSLKSLRALARKPFFVPEQKTAESMLKDFIDTGTSLAIVVDEYGGVSGLVTLEDLVAEIVGEIADEFEPERRTLVEKIGDSEYLLDGALSVREWADLFEDEIEGDVDLSKFDTVGGLVMYLLGRIPKAGDEVSFANVRFRVEEMHRRRVRRIRLSLEAAASGAPGGALR
jgi:putative hemolysin